MSGQRLEKCIDLPDTGSARRSAEPAPRADRGDSYLLTVRADHVDHPRRSLPRSLHVADPSGELLIRRRGCHRHGPGVGRRRWERAEPDDHRHPELDARSRTSSAKGRQRRSGSGRRGTRPPSRVGPCPPQTRAGPVDPAAYSVFDAKSRSTSAQVDVLVCVKDRQRPCLDLLQHGGRRGAAANGINPPSIPTIRIWSPGRNDVSSDVAHRCDASAVTRKPSHCGRYTCPPIRLRAH